MSINRKLIIFFVVILFVLIFINTSSKAALPHFQIKPSRFEILLNPRQRNIQTIRIDNMGEKPLKLIATTKDWNMDSKGDLNLMEPASTARSASNWLRFNPKKINIEPGQSQLIRFSVTAPPDNQSGEYRTAILITAQEEVTTSSARVKIQPQFATLVYLNIPEVIRKGEIKDVKIKANEEKYSFKGNVYSQGNAHLRMTGEYILKNSAGMKIHTGKLRKKVILPGNKDQFKADFGQLEKGDYKLKLIWHYIPAFYMEGEFNEYPVGKESLIKEYEFSVE